jgi:hypothetical protein
VPSPSFTIIETYDPPGVRLPVVHADFYRLEDPAEAEEIGLDDYRQGAVLIAEWPDHAGGLGMSAIASRCVWKSRKTGGRPLSCPAWMVRAAAMTSDLPMESMLSWPARAGPARLSSLCRAMPRSAAISACGGASSAMLMHAPPPQEDPQPFLRAPLARRQRLARAAILAEEAGEGWVLLEDFGDAHARISRRLAAGRGRGLSRGDRHPGATGTPAGRAVHAYGMAEYLRECACSSNGSARRARLCRCGRVPGGVGTGAGAAAARAAPRRDRAARLPCREHHAARRARRAGPARFQDALAGHPAYDLVSLLQDARREVSPELEARMFDYYVQKARPQGDFLADYARLGAQRNTKIVGIFVRLWKRDGKPRYLDYIPASGPCWNAIWPIPRWPRWRHGSMPISRRTCAIRPGAWAGALPHEPRDAQAAGL